MNAVVKDVVREAAVGRAQTPGAAANPKSATAAPARPPAAKPATAHVPVRQERRNHWPLIWTVMVGALLFWGSHAHLERYITPQRGIGYWLGICGGSMMVLLLLYSARKRVSWLRWLGRLPVWFEFHMFLGVVGPVLILFHANFHLGATNSNVALFSMLLVAGSGVVGRYIYTRLHARLDGKEVTLEQLKADGENLRTQAGSIEFLPDFLDVLAGIEKRLIEPPSHRLAKATHLFTGAIRMARARHLVRREIRLAIRRALQRETPLIAKHAQRLAMVARRYAYRRLDAGRRVTEYKAYARMFSWWHVLHIPLFFMLLIAGIAHVIAVNVY